MHIRIAALSAATALALVLVTGAGAAGSATPYRSQTFAPLGIPATKYALPHRFDHPSVHYTLPPDAHAGGRDWWILHLHLRVRLSQPHPGQSTIVAASTNGVGDAYIRFDAGGRQTASFTLRALHTGRTPLGLSANSSSNRQAVVRHVDVRAALAEAPAVAAAGGGGGLGAGWIAALIVLGLTCVGIAYRARRSPRSLAAAVVAGAVVFAFWRPLIHARLSVSLLLAEMTFAVAAALAGRGPASVSRLCCLLSHSCS